MKAGDVRAAARYAGCSMEPNTETELAPDSAHGDDGAVWVARASRGDLAAFEALIARYQKAVYNIALYKSHNVFDAEDLTQDIFLAAFKALPTLERPDNFGAWLFGIAYNRCHKWFRRERRKVVKIQELKERVAREERLRSREARGVAAGPAVGVSEALARLPAEIEEPLRLKYLEGLSYQEMERKLGINAHRIDYLLRKGKQLLRERFGKKKEARP